MKHISSRQGRRIRKTSKKKTFSFLRVLAFLGSPLRKAFFFFLKRPKIFYLLSTATVLVSLSCMAFLGMKRYVDHILPQTVSINVGNPDISDKIRTKINKMLSHVKHQKTTRAEFLKDVNDYLSSIDMIQDYWVRLGLDGRLMISATLHVPLVFLEAKGGETFLLSYGGNILAKNVSRESYPSLFTVYVSDSKIVWWPKSVWLKKGKNASSLSASQTSSAVNLIWLAGQVKLLRDEILLLGADHVLERMSWTSDRGFSLLMSKNGVNSSSFEVILGRDKIPEKISKLHFLLDRLYSENLSAREIDLDFSDKASIRMATKNF